MKISKKITSILLMVALIGVLGLSACGSKADTPTSGAEKFLKDIKKSDATEFTALMTGEKVDEQAKEKKSKEQEEAEKEANNSKQFKMLKDFDYKLGKEKIAKDKKTATVEVTITTYDFPKAIQGYSEEIMKNMAEWQSKGTDQKKLREKMEKILNQHLEKLKKKDVVKDATIELSKNKDGNWEVINIKDNEAFANAISGGMVDATKAQMGETTEQPAEPQAEESQE